MTDKLLFSSIVQECSTWEEQLDKDCAFFSQMEINQALTSSNYSLPALRYSYKILNRYKEFMRLNYADILNHENTPIIPLTEDKTPVDTISVNTQLNYEYLYTEAELQTLIEQQLLSVFDRMFIRAIFEGFDFTTSCENYIYLNAESCHKEDNTVHFHDGRVVTVSDTLMEYLLEGANATTYKRRDGRNSNGRIATIKNLYRDHTQCFKRFCLTEDNMDEKTIRKQILTQFGNIQRIVYPSAKFTIQNIKTSGFIEQLYKLGITNIADPSLIEKPEVQLIMNRYRLLQNQRAYSGFVRRYIK